MDEIDPMDPQVIEQRFALSSIHESAFTELTTDDWYKLDHNDWQDIINEYNDLLAEVKRLREFKNAVRLAIIELQNGEFDEGCEGDLTVVNKSSCEVLYKLIE
tara:strand:- start:83 stop:391 length:309 start_codon:yes stop_codon:yes gene_type:complete